MFWIVLKRKKIKTIETMDKDKGENESMEGREMSDKKFITIFLVAFAFLFVVIVRWLIKADIDGEWYNKVFAFILLGGGLSAMLPAMVLGFPEGWKVVSNSSLAKTAMAAFCLIPIIGFFVGAMVVGSYKFCFAGGIGALYAMKRAKRIISQWIKDKKNEKNTSV